MTDIRMILSKYLLSWCYWGCGTMRTCRPVDRPMGKLWTTKMWTPRNRTPN